MVQMGRKRPDEGHACQVLIQLIKGEFIWVKILHLLHEMGNTSGKARKRLILLLHNVEKGIVGHKTRRRRLLVVTIPDLRKEAFLGRWIRALCAMPNFEFIPTVHWSLNLSHFPM